MRKLTRHTKSKSASTGSKAEKSRIDLWMQRSVWAAQILLFPLAIIGYIFTVRPVYQKQLLDEQIAERSVLLRNAKASVENLSLEQARLTRENKSLASDAETTYASLKANVLNSMPSLGTICSYTPEITGEALYACVDKAVSEAVAKALRPDDRKRLRNALDNHRSEIVMIVAAADKKEREAEAQKTRDLKRLDRVMDAFPRDAIAQIHKLRGDIGPVPKTIEGLGELRNNDEVNIHNRVLDASRTATLKGAVVSLSGISLGGPGSQINQKVSDALRRISAEVEK